MWTLRRAPSLVWAKRRGVNIELMRGRGGLHCMLCLLPLALFNICRREKLPLRAEMKKWHDGNRDMTVDNM
jgi:hypothetical protein